MSDRSISDRIILQAHGLTTRIGSTVVHRDLDLELHAGEVLAVVGASGSGKSVLLRTLLGLMHPAAGKIEAFGQDLSKLDDRGMRQIERRWGVLFQDGALFSSLTVAENVGVPLKETLGIAAPLRNEIAALKIALAGLPPDAGAKYPSELSGGMRKRAGLARALALDPELLFLDEPTSGLDPISAADFDKLLADLRTSLGLTVFMVTHDLDQHLYHCRSRRRADRQRLRKSAPSMNCARIATPGSRAISAARAAVPRKSASRRPSPK